ncbi:MAG: polysaccharide biosynthesis protein [Desulfovibrionaceae bacterium]
MAVNLRNGKFWVMLLADAVIFTAALLGAYLLRFDLALPEAYRAQVLGMLCWVVPVKLALFFGFGMYKGMWRYTSLPDFYRLQAVTLLQSVLIAGGYWVETGFAGYPRSVFVLDWVYTLFGRVGLRVDIRSFSALRSGTDAAEPARRALMVGAGRAGELVWRELATNARLNYQLVGFVDDDPAKQGRAIHNKPVLGGVDRLAELVRERGVGEVFIAVSQATPQQMRRVVEQCEASGAAYKILPALGEIMDGRVDIKTLRDVDYLDLLGRSEVRLDEGAVRGCIEGRTVLVTGCGGSIGSELVRQLVRFSPGRLVLVDHSEYNLYQIEMELKWELGFTAYATVLGSVADAALMDEVFGRERPALVLHAAAYKHVPMLERNPWQAVANNILGTRTVMDAAGRHGAERFVLVSTDKAVRPCNVMGASKRVAERLMEARSGRGTVFAAVRFGNVVGSSGSVVPLFRRQIERGGPVTVTHPEVTRYFMSISEACQLILQAGAMARGGEIFVLDMGVPVRIADMARDLIRLSGKEPDVDVPIVFTGLREGEKLYEELIAEDEGVVRTEHEKIKVLGRLGSGESAGGPDEGPGQGLEAGVAALVEAAARHDAEAVRQGLRTLVPEYTPATH